MSENRDNWVLTWICLPAVAAALLFSRSAQAGGDYTPTNSYWRPIPLEVGACRDYPYAVRLFNPQNGEDGARAWSQSKSLFFYGLGVVGVLAALPESATGWDTDSDIFAKWANNVREGPVWDRDNWAYNYIGHTYCGGVYYQVARKSGYRQWDSFVYSFLMSTFYWEYGVEAFAETPSVQDLVVTPVMGWVYGEWAYRTEMRIRDAGSEVMGSRMLGGVSLFFLDPIDTLGRGVNHLAGRRWIKAGYGYFTYTAVPEESETDHTLMLNMIFPVGMPAGAAGPEEEQALRMADAGDPVDTGIVGFAAGAAGMVFDNKRQLGDGFGGKYSLGLYFTPRFSARLAYFRGEAEDSVSGNMLVYENYSLDAQYYLNTGHGLRPYVTAGIGEELWEKQNDSARLLCNAGVGLHWQVHRKWAVQADWINFFEPSIENHDQQFGAGLVYRFGDGEHHDW